jgi:transglutaminase-like putative cysteine protease
MGSRERIEPARTTVIADGHVLSRRDFLKVAGLAGLGVAGSQMVPGFGNQEGAAAASAGGDPISDLAAALDYDAERIFRFVADEIRYDPYAGILRGARGTLASRAGNSADQALLLAALLDASLLPVRFAVGEIDTATADTLMASTEADVESIRRHGLQALAGTLPGGEPAPVELTPEQQRTLDDAFANGDRVASWAREQLERTVGTITSALEEAGVELTDGLTPIPDSERSRHVWVQVAATDDWVDLDPTMPGATPGGASTAAAETLDALPEDMAHLV